MCSRILYIHIIELLINDKASRMLKLHCVLYTYTPLSTLRRKLLFIFYSTVLLCEYIIITCSTVLTLHIYLHCIFVQFVFVFLLSLLVCIFIVSAMLNEFGAFMRNIVSWMPRNKKMFSQREWHFIHCILSDHSRSIETLGINIIITRVSNQITTKYILVPQGRHTHTHIQNSYEVYININRDKHSYCVRVTILSEHNDTDSDEVSLKRDPQCKITLSDVCSHFVITIIIVRLHAISRLGFLANRSRNVYKRHFDLTDMLYTKRWLITFTVDVDQSFFSQRNSHFNR